MSLPAVTQLEGESTKAYEAFRHYAKMGDQRSQGAVAKKLHKSRELIGRWSSRYGWKERIMQWNAEQADRENTAKEQAALEVARRRQARKELVAERAWEIAERMFEKARVMANWPLQKQTRTGENGENIVIEPLDTWRQSDAARLAEAGDSLAPLAFGMPQRHTAVKGADGEALPSVVVQPIVSVVMQQTDETRELEKRFNVLPD